MRRHPRHYVALKEKAMKKIILTADSTFDMPFEKAGALDIKVIPSYVSTDGDNVFIRIRDYGPGIPEDELERVKMKFYKGSSKERGSGIGLAVCDEIIKYHGGELTLSNAQGGGTMVTIRIPVEPTFQD